MCADGFGFIDAHPLLSHFFCWRAKYENTKVLGHNALEAFNDSLLLRVSHHVFVHSIWPCIAEKLWDLYLSTSMQEAHLRVGTMLAMQHVNHE